MVDQIQTHRMAMSEDMERRIEAINQLRTNLRTLPNNRQAWDDLHNLTQDKDRNVRLHAVDTLGLSLQYIPDRVQAWGDLHRLTYDKDSNVRWGASMALGIALPYLPDKVQAWEDLHRLTHDKDSNVRWGAIEALYIGLPYLPDRVQAWEDLHNLTQDDDNDVRWQAANGLSIACPYIPDKKQVWEDLISLIHDKDSSVRWRASKTLSIVFLCVPDRDLAWEDLHELTHHEDSNVRLNIAYSIGSSFLYISDKRQAWDNLHNLAQDVDIIVREETIGAILAAFPHIPDKNKGWYELYRLTQDKEANVRWIAATALGTAFPYTADKDQAWTDLYKLTQSQDTYLRAHAYYSLGKVSIFKSTEAENKENFRKELEKALEFFEKSLKEKTSYFFNPAKFCLPFYRSFYLIIFREQKADTEIHKYLSEAKKQSLGSESKEMLLEAIENLANALDEAYKAKEDELDVIKRDLNAYRRYCDQTVELLKTMGKKAPRATRLIRKGLPIIDQRIKEIIAEIQKNAKSLCKQTLDTSLEDLGKEVNRVSQAFSQIRDPIGLEKGFSNLQMALSAICAKMPEEERGEACELLKKAKDEPYIEDKIDLINMVLSKISSQMSNIKNIEILEKKLDEILVSLKPGIHEELTITVGAEFLGTGAQHVITIPMQEISYPELRKDLEYLKGKNIFKFAMLPAKIRDYLKRNNKEELLKTLS